MPDPNREASGTPDYKYKIRTTSQRVFCFFLLAILASPLCPVCSFPFKSGGLWEVLFSQQHLLKVQSSLNGETTYPMDLVRTPWESRLSLVLVW